MQRRLKKWSDLVSLEIVDDPLDALMTIAAAPPHAVVIDVVMPGTSGIELCRALRKHPETRSAVVFAVSAHMSPTLADEARAAGANHAVEKPIDVRFLLNEIGIAAESRR
jgi:CheY-like chemotaxis protein